MEPIQDPDIEMIRLCLTADDLAPPPYPGALAALDRLVAERDAMQRKMEKYRAEAHLLTEERDAVVAERDRLITGIGALVEDIRADMDANVSHVLIERLEALTKTTEERPENTDFPVGTVGRHDGLTDDMGG